MYCVVFIEMAPSFSYHHREICFLHILLWCYTKRAAGVHLFRRTDLTACRALLVVVHFVVDAAAIIDQMEPAQGLAAAGERTRLSFFVYCFFLFWIRVCCAARRERRACATHANAAAVRLDPGPAM